MIIKIVDFYYETELSTEATRAFIDSVLSEHVKEDDELSIEHLLDDIEENEEFESAPDAYEAQLEITIDELEERATEILDADDEFDDDDDDGDDQDYDEVSRGFVEEDDYYD